MTAFVKLIYLKAFIKTHFTFQFSFCYSDSLFYRSLISLFVFPHWKMKVVFKCLSEFLLSRKVLGLQLRHCSLLAPEQRRQLLWHDWHCPSSPMNVLREQSLKNSQCPLTSILMSALQVRHEDGWGPEHVRQDLSHSKKQTYLMSANSYGVTIMIAW